MESFEATGIWFLPGGESATVPGIVRYTKDEGPTLQLLGSFTARSGSDFAEYPVVFGYVNDSRLGSCVSLHRVFTTKRTFGVGPRTETMKGNLAFVGGQHVPEGARFGSARVTVEALDTWTGAKGADVTFGGPRIVDVRIPEAVVETSEHGGLGIRVRRGSGMISIAGGGSVTFSANASVDATAHEPLDVDGWSRTLFYPTQNLLTFISRHPRALLDVQLSSASKKNDDDEGWVHLRYSPTWPVQAETNGADRDFLISPTDELSAAELLRRWLAFSEKFSDFSVIWFGSVYGAAKFIDTRFAERALALRLLLQGQRRARGIAVHSDVAMWVDAEHLLAHPDWARIVAPTAMELRFPWALHEAVVEHEELMGPILAGSPTEFVSDVVAASRFVQSREGQHPGGVNLHWLTERMKVLVEVLVLGELGLGCADVYEQLRERRAYRHLATRVRGGNVKCPTCGVPMKNVAGLGAQKPEYVCANGRCLSHYRHVKCPECQSPPRTVDVLGLGHQEFNCVNGHRWSSI